MLLNSFHVAPLVHAFRLHHAPAQRALAASVGKATQGRARVRRQHTQHAVQVAIVEGVSRALQMVVIGKDLLGPGNIAGRTLQFNRIGAQIDVDVQTVFQHMQVFIPGTEQGFNVRSNLNALLHSVLAHPSLAGYALLATLMLR